jgi:RNA polymerase sigma-70 factor (ECF subfamily)
MSWNDDGAGRPDEIGLEHLDELYSYALVLTRNHAEAEDLVQETYVRAIPAMGRLRADSNTKGWLFTLLNGSAEIDRAYTCYSLCALCAACNRNQT